MSDIIILNLILIKLEVIYLACFQCDCTLWILPKEVREEMRERMGNEFIMISFHTITQRSNCHAQKLRQR